MTSTPEISTRDDPDPPVIALTQSSMQHFDTKFAGTIVPIKPNDFIEIVNKHINTIPDNMAIFEGGSASHEKHLWMPNFVGAKAEIARITDQNRKYLRSGYEAPMNGDLPILTRWFESVMPPEAAYLNIVLYSSAQLKLEADEQNNSDIITTPWGIVAIRAEVARSGTPLKPMTIVRNAIRAAEDGAPFALDHEEYLESVLFWEKHATARHFL